MKRVDMFFDSLQDLEPDTKRAKVESYLATSRRELAETEEDSVTRSVMTDLVERLESTLVELSEQPDNLLPVFGPRLPYNKYSAEMKKRFKEKFDEIVEDYGYDINHTLDQLRWFFPDLTYDEVRQKIRTEKPNLE